MTTDKSDLSRMILAARQIGEVVGEDLFDGLFVSDDPPSLAIRIQGYDSMGYETPIRQTLPDQIALDLLTARVWRAVRKWAVSFNWQDDATTGEHIAVWHKYNLGDDVYMAPDLPSAVAAIHKHWKESR